MKNGLKEKMQLLTLLCLCALVYGGVVSKSPGLSDFWTDDYKVFEQVYGKTSDRDLYGDTLPMGHTNLGKFTHSDASEKKERYSLDIPTFTDFDKYSFGDKYAKIFAKQILEEDDYKPKPAKSFNFISYTDFKPISQHTDPETYKYLKQLEQYTKEETAKIPRGVGGFQPYVGDSEEKLAYKSIQDILEAHEANKSGEKSNEDEEDDERDGQIKYLTNGSGKSRNKSNDRKKPGSFAEPTKPRCRSGRCRKRATTSVRVRTRPYVRKITQNRWITG